LLGKIPFIIFDEFDSFYEGNLGWLKYFLAPMQDSVYREEEAIHPIGKAIFVFAGGTSSSFNEFCLGNLEDEHEIKQFTKDFKAAKGPDFVSRLRGYVNILGPNQTSDNDQLYILRRAMSLRSLIDKKLPQLINDKNEAQIDNGVVRAMLKVPRFKHETRSIEAIIDMSMLNRAQKWEQSFLPSKEQLSLHVDENQFMRYMMYDAIFSEKVEQLAAELRRRYNSLDNSIPIDEDDITVKWKHVNEFVKNFYRCQIKSIPNSLLKIQCDVIYVDDVPEKMIFSQQEIEQMAHYEYKRRTVISREKCVDHDMTESSDNSESIPLEKADADIKTQIYQMVKLWADVLVYSNFKVERLRFDE
jgi:hypothetical protein